MGKILLIFGLFFLSQDLAFGQGKLMTKEGNVYFLSSAPMEKIEATNAKATSVFDTSTGAIEWAVLIKAFHFEKALMEEHFNENYMESTKFPKAKFKGKVDNLNAINFKKDGTYKVKISGDLEVHGVTNKVTTDATFTINKGNVKALSKFTIAVADYGIKIPSLVKDKVAKNVEISVTANYIPLTK